MGVWCCPKCGTGRWVNLTTLQCATCEVAAVDVEAIAGAPRPSAGECPKCRGPLSRDGSRYFCDACRVHAKCQREACLVEEWRVDGFCSTHCADLAEVEEERDDAIAEAAGLCMRNVDLEKLLAERDAQVGALRAALEEIAGMNVGARHIAAQALAKVTP